MHLRPCEHTCMNFVTHTRAHDFCRWLPFFAFVFVAVVFTQSQPNDTKFSSDLD